MRQVDRTLQPAPACLSDERTALYRKELRRIFATDMMVSSQTRVDLRSLALEDDSLDRALNELFDHKCAFCESRVHSRAYRFRPTEEAGPIDAAPAQFADRGHLYYTWLANSWSNIYPICNECRPRSESVFPVIGRRCDLPDPDEVYGYVTAPTGSWKTPPKERPEYLDPCASDDFRKHLALLATGQMIGLSQRGAATIRHFNLDRTTLEHQRRKRTGEYIRLLLSSAKEGRIDSSLIAFDSMEFGGGWFLLLYQLARRIGGGGGSRPTLSRKRIGRYFSERLSNPDFLNRLETALEQLQDREAILETGATSARPPEVRRVGNALPATFEIKNFKALEDIRIDLASRRQVPSNPLATNHGETAHQEPTAPCLVILGENAAGKSSILEAMALVLSEQSARDDLVLDAGRFVLNPKWMGGDEENAPRRGAVQVIYDNDEQCEVTVDSGFRFIKGADTPRVPVFAYGAFRLFLKDGKRRRPGSAIRSLFEANYVLPNPEKWLASIADTPLFFEVARALKFILAIDQEVDVIEADARRKQCFLVVNSRRADGSSLVVRTPFSAVSSGFRAILAMACDIMRGLAARQDRSGASLARARAVVLIDEVEAHLHPRWKMQIVGGLRNALPEVAFIMTTHDPLCLRGLSSDEVRVFHRINSATDSVSVLPSYVEQIGELPAIGALTIEQLLTSDLFRLHSTDAPELDANFAIAGDLLAKEQEGGMGDEETAKLAKVREILRRQVGRSLPIGSTEIERLVQKAVEEYLIDRRHRSSADTRALSAKARAKIMDALGGI
ncbi:putative AbiEii toxin of type IV toxin-antitoxin system [Rhodobacter viridis]|uniref:Putative AbiEii toxin of type IV toxin-antitoxin system n=1 Tax=Rhodobacter viridis TaxID=1054202 RepID=A0A318TQZ1_9RHOB|nr:AAA family ATPase [Rhodobacter viridis]PYF06763.1 putative AbiEii toxin of type IV toxin-antitoxin system [Rhodobacter viridis]